MREVFDDMKAINKTRKQRNLDESYKVDDGNWKKHTEYHWSRVVDGAILNYWPSRNKFQYRGKIMTGDVGGFLTKRDPNYTGVKKLRHEKTNVDVYREHGYEKESKIPDVDDKLHTGTTS